jgi:phosphoglucomutase
MESLAGSVSGLAGRATPLGLVTGADAFTYEDPVDGSISPNQGVRVFLEDGSRIVYRLSGTGTQGATLRMYLERYLPPGADHAGSGPALTSALGDLAAEIAQMKKRTGIDGPSGII